LTFDASHRELVPGLIVRMPFVAHQSDPAFRIPMAALTRGDRGLWSVLAVVRVEGADSPKVERRDIELLHTDGDHAFVRGMLAPGDRIVADGTHRLVTGQRVQVMDGTSPNRLVALQQ
jgi:multidrug efflux pump subunit AcrA (membrane-fusion protein)